MTGYDRMWLTLNEVSFVKMKKSLFAFYFLGFSVFNFFYFYAVESPA